MDYKNGKIYKIVCDTIDRIYIGSTCQTLCKRHSKHRTSYKSYINNKRPFTTSFELIKLGNTDIILIENYPCNSKEELHARERYWIEHNKDIVVNKVVPLRTDKEYYQANKEKICKDGKEYYQANKEKISKSSKEYRTQNKEKICKSNKEYKQANKEKISKTDKEYYQANKDKLLEKIICKCGCECVKSNLTRHYKTRKHIKLIEEQAKIEIDL